MSLTGFAVGSIEYSLWYFGQLASIRLTIHRYAHLPSPITTSGSVCLWLDRVFSPHL